MSPQTSHQSILESGQENLFVHDSQKREKRCATVLRVSTTNQLAPDGSLMSQAQLIDSFRNYRSQAENRPWRVVYEVKMEAISGKDSLEHDQMIDLVHRVQRNEIDVVICVSFDRVSRKVTDFLSFVEFLNNNGVEFISLRQSLDTTTPQGKLMLTVISALAQFERELTSERMKENRAVKAKQGRWGGGIPPMGYDLHPTEKDALVVDQPNAEIIRTAFSLYREMGSIKKVREKLNLHGYRTREFTSRRGTVHQGTTFAQSTLEQILTNYFYVGEKEVNKRNNPARKKNIDKDFLALPENQRYARYPGNWEPIIDTSLFMEVQEIMEGNRKTGRSLFSDSRRVYLLSGGLLNCGKCCEGTLEGFSGTSGSKSKGKTVHYYYKCNFPGCGVSLPAIDLEESVLGLLGRYGKSRPVDKLVSAANKILLEKLPQLKSDRQILSRKLGSSKSKGSKLALAIGESLGGGGREVWKKEMEQVGEEIKGLEDSLQKLEDQIGSLDREKVDEKTVKEAFDHFREVVETLTPSEKKSLVRLLIDHITIANNEVLVYLKGDGLPPEWAGGFMESSERFVSPPLRLPKRYEAANRAVLGILRA